MPLHHIDVQYVATGRTIREKRLQGGEPYLRPSPDHATCLGGHAMPRGAASSAREVQRVSYLDPRGHVHTIDRQMSGRLGEVRGAVAALLDNEKDTSRFFFDSLAHVLK